MKRMWSLALVATFSSSVAFAAEPAPTGIPPAERFQLDNGLTVLLVPSQGNPILEIQLAFRAGGGADPAGKEGLASLTGRMLSAGTKSLEEQALAAELATLGAWIGPDSGMESIAIGGQIPTLSEPDVRRFLDLFVEMALHPTFPEAVLEREKTLRLGLFRRVADNAESLAEIATKLAAYGNNAFGWVGYGTPRSVANLSRADLVAFHGAVFNPSHGVLVVGGAFDAGAMRAWIERRFGSASGWGAGQSAVDGAIPGRKKRLCIGPAVQPNTADPICFDNALASAPAAGAAHAAKTIHVVVDDEALTQIPWRLVAPNPVAMLDAGWPAFKVGTFVLGGEYTSRLNTILRVREGLTYGAYFEPAFGGHFSGAMNVSTDATPDALDKSITLAKGAMQALAAAPLEAAELERFKAMLVNQFAFKFETISATLGQYLTLELASLPLGWLASWRDVLARPTPAEVQAAMGKVDPAKMTLVVAGPKGLGPLLEKLGHGELVTVSATQLLTTGLP